jgi:ABC-type transport system involved in multi-copper enzyme maturation permease subunit
MAKHKKDREKSLVFSKINSLLLISAIIIVIIGFSVVNASPNVGAILLVLGYAVLVPLALLIRPQEAKDSKGPPERKK